MYKFTILAILSSVLLFNNLVSGQIESVLSTEQPQKNQTITTTTAAVNLKSDDIKHYELSSGNYLDIRVPQSSSLEKFQSLGRAYSFPPNTNFEEYYALYKKNYSSEEEKTITSPEYPKPYPIPVKQNYDVTVDSGSGIELIIHFLDIHTSKDFLKISLQPSTTINNEDNNENSVVIKSSRPIILTGSLKEPFKIRALSCTKIKIEFEAQERDAESSTNHKGFLITYKPFGEKLPKPTIPPDVTLPFDELDSISKLLVVDRSKQTHETWMKMKMLFCNATNKFLNISPYNYFEPCYPQNVTFTNIVHCPQSWPDSLNCIELYFAIQLYDDIGSMTTIDPFVIKRFPREPSGLNHSSLAEMWNKYGRNVFKNAGYTEYIKASPNDQLLLWLGLGVGLILVLFIIGVAVLKAGIIKNKYNGLKGPKGDETKVYKNQNDIDITMYPSPDQVVPELFPGHSNVYGNEIGYNAVNGRLPTVNERRISREVESTQMIQEGINPAYIEDDEERISSSFRMRVNGVIRDEANS